MMVYSGFFILSVKNKFSPKKVIIKIRSTMASHAVQISPQEQALEAHALRHSQHNRLQFSPTES